jgi:hypothetical protein
MSSDPRRCIRCGEQDWLVELRLTVHLEADVDGMGDYVGFDWPLGAVRLRNFVEDAEPVRLLCANCDAERDLDKPAPDDVGD